MQIAIEDVQNMLDRLPKDSTIEDVQYHLYVMEKLKKSKASLEENGGVPHEEAKKRMQKWLIK